jgi:dTDP-glucose 4,6-dehydratase
MHYFVTGGAGFIGSNYVKYLFQNKKNLSRVTIYDKFTYAANQRNYKEFESDERLKIIKGDICDLDLLQKSIIGHDYVVHFAAESHVDRSIDNASEFIQTNVLGTFNVLEASRNAGIKTVIHVSTDEVYGSLAEGSADENYPIKPNSPYAASKASSDLLARSFFVTHGLDVRTTRSCNNYGKYQFPEKIIPLFISKLSRMEKLPIYGDGKNVREWINVEDNVRGIQLVLDKGLPGEIYNIGTGEHLSNNDLASSIIKTMKCNNDMKSYVADRKGHDFRYSVDSKKIESLGFSKTVNFDLGLKETINWYVSNPNWWQVQKKIT